MLHFHNAPIFLSKYCKDLIEVPVAKLQSSVNLLFVILMILIHLGGSNETTYDCGQVPYETGRLVESFPGLNKEY